jgi:DNA-binding transcriptional LysR family regulator
MTANVSDVRIRQLQAFQAVAQTGSFTAAARLLNISQPAVSRLIRSLSATTGFVLFSREDGRSVPTPEARLLLAEAGRVLDMLAGFETLHRGLRGQTAGHLRVACLPGFATTHLPGVLARFLRDREQVRVTLEPDRPERLLDWLLGGHCEIVITADFAGHPAVHSRRIPIRTVCILPPGHALAAHEEITPALLREERLVHTRDDDPFHEAVRSAFETCGVAPRSTVETRQFGAACRLVAEGAGVSIVSELDSLEYGWTGIVRRPFFPRIPHNLDILHSRLSPSSRIGLEFLEAFEASLQPYRAETSGSVLEGFRDPTKALDPNRAS